LKTAASVFCCTHAHLISSAVHDRQIGLNLATKSQFPRPITF